MEKNLRYRNISLSELNQDAYFALYKNVYEGINPLKRRWRWEYINHPLAAAIRFVVAEDGQRLAAATTRLPFDISINGTLMRAYFSVDSMVDADYRRMGIMQRLYSLAAETMPLLYSKGTMPSMYKLLMRFGYQSISPNTFLVFYLRPLKLLMKRLGLADKGASEMVQCVGYPLDYQAVDRFGEEFDAFWERVSIQFNALVVKTSKYMNWRFKEIPHKKYHCFYRKDAGGDIIAMVVLSAGETIGKIVDLLWDPQTASEPANTIAFSKAFIKSCGCIKILCWCTHKRLRGALKKQRFIDRKETPRFSVYSTIMDQSLLKDGSAFHFMDGDGDYDFL